MEHPQSLTDENFPLFKPTRKPSINPSKPKTPQNAVVPNQNPNPDTENIENSTSTTFADLGLSDWALKTCKELGMRTPRRVQRMCIPKILQGRHVIGIDETGSGKTAAFALPILHRLGEHPYGVFALVMAPTRELAFQLSEQFRALGSSLRLRIAVIVGGMDMLKQTKELVARPHVVIATPGRIKALLQNCPDIPPVFSNTKHYLAGITAVAAAICGAMTATQNCNATANCVAAKDCYTALHCYSGRYDRYLLHSDFVVAQVV